jgi:outer membrane protein insertion porin family
MRTKDLRYLPAFILGLPALSQAVTFDGRPVLKVVYSPSQQPLSSKDLTRLQWIKAGSPFSARDVAQTIDSFFATGAYSNIQADVREEGGALTITLLRPPSRLSGTSAYRERSQIRPVEVPWSALDFFRLGTPFHQEDLQTAEKNIRQLFTSNGLYEADVSLHTQIDPETNLVTVAIRVKAGKRARYAMPSIMGQTKLAESTIVRATGWRIILIHRWRQFSQTLTATGLEGIRRKYKNKDLLTASVELAGVDYDAEARRLKPRLEIEAGPTVEVKAVEAKLSKSRLKRLIPIYEEGWQEVNGHNEAVVFDPTAN